MRYRRDRYERRQPANLQVGDLVYHTREYYGKQEKVRGLRKLLGRWRGPSPIVAARGNSYDVETEPGVTRVFNIEHLSPYQGENPPVYRAIPLEVDRAAAQSEMDEPSIAVSADQNPMVSTSVDSVDDQKLDEAQEMENEPPSSISVRLPEDFGLVPDDRTPLIVEFDASEPADAVHPVSHPEVVVTLPRDRERRKSNLPQRFREVTDEPAHKRVKKGPRQEPEGKKTSSSNERAVDLNHIVQELVDEQSRMPAPAIGHWVLAVDRAIKGQPSMMIGKITDIVASPLQVKFQVYLPKSVHKKLMFLPLWSRVDGSDQTASSVQPRQLLPWIMTLEPGGEVAILLSHDTLDEHGLTQQSPPKFMVRLRSLVWDGQLSEENLTELDIQTWIDELESRVPVDFQGSGEDESTDSLSLLSLTSVAPTIGNRSASPGDDAVDVVPSSLSKKRRWENSLGDAKLQITLDSESDNYAKRRKVTPVISPPRKSQVRFLLPDTGSASVEQGGVKSPGESR